MASQAVFDFGQLGVDPVERGVEPVEPGVNPVVHKILSREQYYEARTHDQSAKLMLQMRELLERLQKGALENLKTLELQQATITRIEQLMNLIERTSEIRRF